MTYVPFLKAKSNEIIALGSLPSEISERVCPFFDYPRKSGGGYTADELAASILKTAKSFGRHLSAFPEFYLDCFDLGEAVRPAGVHCYEYILDAFSEFPVIPVVSLDRSPEHIEVVFDAKSSGTLESSTVAIRLTPADFESFDAIEADLEDILDSTFNLFDGIDLVFDCRVCSGLDINATVAQVLDFAEKFIARYGTRRNVFSGSSIPASIRDLLATNAELTLPRTEFSIYNGLHPNSFGATFAFGDYTIISPNYSDADLPPEMLHNIMTAKLTYSFGQSHFFVRGSSLKTEGREQYQEMAELICDQDFYRGSSYSAGDQFLMEKSLGQGSLCMPHTVIKPAIIAHVTFTVREVLPP